MKLEGCIRKQPLADRRVGCALYNEVILPRIELQTYIYIYTHACLHRLYLDEPASFGGSCAACATTIFFFFFFFFWELEMLFRPRVCNYFSIENCCILIKNARIRL